MTFKKYLYLLKREMLTFPNDIWIYRIKKFLLGPESHTSEFMRLIRRRNRLWKIAEHMVNTVCDSNKVTNDFCLKKTKTNGSLIRDFLDDCDLKKVTVCNLHYPFVYKNNLREMRKRDVELLFTNKQIDHYMMHRNFNYETVGFILN